MTATEPDPPRLLRVVRGEPSTEELAAVVAVMAAVAARAAAVRDRAARPRSVWGDPARATRQLLPVGPDGWRRSALPR